MNAHYTVGSDVISVFMWEDFLDNEDWRKTAHVRVIENGHYSDKEVSKKIYKDEGGIYIFWNRKKVYLNDFNYLPYNDLIAKVQEGIDMNDRWHVWDDEIWATFMKEFEKVSIVSDMPMYDVLIPQMGIGMVGDKTVPVICKLDEGQYPRNRMGYKLTLACKDDSLRGIVASQSYYFSDFCDMLKSGIFKLVPEDFVIQEPKKTFVQKAREVFGKKENPHTIFVYK